MAKPHKSRKSRSRETCAVSGRYRQGAQKVGKHPLDEPSEIRAHRFSLSLVASLLLTVLLATEPHAGSLRGVLGALVRNRKLELILGVVGVLLMLVDVVGTERLRVIDRWFLKMFGNQSNRLFLRGGFKRIAAYYRAYIGPGFWYERDVLFSWLILLNFVGYFGLKESFWLLVLKTAHPDAKDILWVTWWVLWAALGFHTLCRIPRRVANPGRVHWTLGHIGFSLLILSTLPWAICKLTFYFWCYLVYAPLDLIATLSAKLNLQGSLKIVGGALAVTALVISYLRS